MQHPLIDPLEIRKLAVEIVEDVVSKERPIPHTSHHDRSGKVWWRDNRFQDQIEDEMVAKIADWLEFRLARL